MLVDLARAQRLFDGLPQDLQLPTLSPAYVAADSLRDPLLTPLFLVWEHGEGFLMHAVHEAGIPGVDQTDWQSAYGYGGPIAHDLTAEMLSEAWSVFDQVARERRAVVEFVRFHPLIDNHRLYPGAVRAQRKVVQVDLIADDLMSGYTGRARTAIRKAIASGLHVKWESAADARQWFPAFYREGMRQIEASDFYIFSDSYFSAVLKLSGARVLSVLNGDERVAMGLFLFGPRTVEYHLSATAPAGRAMGATNLLLHEAARTAKDEGREALYLGGGTSTADDDPLLRFKSSFAAPQLCFYIGHRVHDSRAYALLREAHANSAQTSDRVLFYRR